MYVLKNVGEIVSGGTTLATKENFFKARAPLSPLTWTD